MKRFSIFLSVFLFPFVLTHAQTVVINTGTAGTPAYNAGPIYRSSTTSSYDASRYTYLYTASELAAAGITSGAIINEVGWVKNNTATSTGGGIFRIFMKNSSATTFSAATETWANLNASATMTYENLNFTVPATAAPNYITFPFTTNFVYTGGSLEISTEWDINQVSGNASTGTFDWLWSTVTDCIYGTGQTSLANAGTLSSTTNSISTIDDRRPFIQISFTPGSPCTSPPNPGTATTTSTGTVCPGTPFTLNITGNSTGAGQTYVWESSPNIGGPYTAISSSSSNTSLAVNATSTLYYRAQVTCGASTLPSTPVQVSVTSGFPGGTYTINAGAVTGGTNFNSFTDAAAAINCGIAGPIVFNVVANSGPYNEQMILPAIGGTSATNTITFNGNGNTIAFSSANTNERATIKLDGTDYVTINNLVVDASAGTYGYGIQLLNDADNNTINGCTILGNTSSTSTSAYAGILINSTATAITTTGASLCDNNTITGNTITGGYAGIALVGNSASSVINSNQVTNNTINDFYLYGIYLNGGNNTLIEGNDLSRPTRTSVGNFDGVYLTGVSTNTLISKNKFHNPFDGNPASTSASFAIYLTTCDATAGNENIVSNNITYNMVGGTGNQNGFLNNSSDYVKAYYNTFFLDDATSATTNGTRGFYVQGTTASVGLEYRNNIVSIGRGGTGDKQCIFFEAAATVFAASNNDYYISSTTGLTEIGHLGPAATGTGYTTIATWQTATSQDANSVSIDPLFSAPATGNLAPTAAGLDDLGIPVTGITTDILNTTRSSTTPDMGAYEFSTAPTCAAPTGLAASNITSNSADLSWTAITGIIGYEYALNTNSTPPAGGTQQTAATYPASGLTPSTLYYFHVRTNCSGTATSGWTTISFSTLAAPVCNAPSAPVITNITTATADVNWGTVTGAIGYEYEVSTNATPPTSGTSTGTTSYNATGLTGNTQYYAHVRTDCGTTGSSAWVTTPFNTADTCLAPTAAITNITDTTADISWTAMSGALSYEYEVSTNAAPPANGTNITTTSYNAINLAKNTLHYVHLRTICTNDTSDWSTANFTTTNLTSVHSIGNGAGLDVYPNPVHNVLMIKITGVSQVDAVITLSDITGKTVKLIMLTKDREEVDMSNLSQGVYLLKYTDDSGSSTIRVVKE